MTKKTTDPSEEKVDFMISGSIDIAGHAFTYSAGAGKRKGSLRLVLEVPVGDAAPLLATLAEAMRAHFSKKADSK